MFGIGHEHEVREVGRGEGGSESGEGIVGPDVRVHDGKGFGAKQRQRAHDAARRFERLVFARPLDRHAELRAIAQRGDFGLSADRLTEAAETQRYTYSGVAAFHPQLFAGMSEGKAPLLPVLGKAVGLGRASGEVYGGGWIDVGTPERLAALDRQLTSSKQGEAR